MTQVIDFIGGEYRIRTGVHGFAIRCVTTPPTRQLPPPYSHCPHGANHQRASDGPARERMRGYRQMSLVTLPCQVWEGSGAGDGKRFVISRLR